MQKKETWSDTSPEKIARHFGYQPDGIFLVALKKFMENIVDSAEITEYLPSLADNFFLTCLH